MGGWLIPASAVLLLPVIILVARRIWRLRARQWDEAPPRLSTSGDFGPEVSSSADPRVRQFLHSGTHRMPEPDSSASDLRHEVQAMAEEADVASDLATLDAFLADVRDALGADEAVFWRWSEARDALTPASWSTRDSPKPVHFDIKAWGALVQWSAEQRMLNFDADARVAVTRMAAGPVEHEGRLMGVLTVSRAEGLDRGREHIKSWLPRHATQVGRLVSLFELRREYGRYMRQSHALLKAAQSVQGHKSQETLSRAICETAVKVTSATDAALIRWRSDVARGWVQFATEGFRHRPPFQLSSDSMAARASIEGTLLLIDDTSKMTGTPDLFFEKDGGWPRGTLGVVPLKVEERVIGAIVVVSDRPNAITREEARNIALLGALAGTSLEMVWEMEEVTRRARTDALTGLANRRAFDEQLESLIAHADRFGHSVSLILADVDHFKQVNDTLGHAAGDVVLKSLARTFTEAVRAVDVCARFGGEEIAILLPQTTLAGAVELADRLRKQVAAKPILAGGTEIPVTISCGVACYPEGVLTKEALFAAADRAMYEAKSAGRNCVRSASPKPTGVVR
jgi:diguanylate cyclase (GGDEF)-like protein